MSHSFPTVPTVTVGERVTSAQFNALSAAVRARMRSGLGDPCYRIQQYFFRLWRLPRNPDSTGLVFAPADEAYQIYHHLDPETEWVWPIEDPGDFEGANLANPLMAMIFGNPSVASEVDRINEKLVFDPGSSTLEEIWTLGKMQRGGYDPDTGSQYAPAMAAAQDYYRIVQPAASFHGKSYGSWQPSPEFLGMCSGDDDDIPSFQIKFTSLIDASVVTYPGTCPSVSGHVAGVWSGPFAYFVYTHDGSGGYNTATYNKKEWIEGPYTGTGRLRKPDGEQVSRLALNAFIREFRGTAEQRVGDDWDIQRIGFHFEEFLSQQYLLSPNIAAVDGEFLVTLYPSFEFSGSATIAADTFASETYAYEAGYVLGGVWMKATGLSQSVTLALMDGSTVIQEFTLTPSEPQAMEWFTDGRTPANLRVKLVTDAAFTDGTGKIEIETTEQLAYKPEIHDAYLFLRCASALIEGFTYDRRGIDEHQSRQIFERYRQHGCIVPINSALAIGEHTPHVTPNPIYDAARRITRDNVRIIPRRQLVDYEVVDGKSVLYFHRQAFGLNDADMWSGIADAIAHTPPPGGRTNEWLMFMQSTTLVDSELNIWKPSVYGDFFPFNNRCLFYSPNMAPGMNDEQLRHFTEGQAVAIAPEAASGYNYSGSLNNSGLLGGTDARTDFYKSCPIYKPDYEIESVVDIGGTNPVVKVTLTSRLQHHADAPAAMGKFATWDSSSITALNGESYRTDENTVRQYLAWWATDASQAHKIGDAAGSSSIWSAEGAMQGSILPRFFLTRLPPLVYEDGNSTRQTHDALVDVDDMIQNETYLRAMCEGYLDEATTGALACSVSSPGMYDYTFENLCFEANGERWITMLPESLRPDRPQGFGPLPQVRMFADLYNQLARCWNKLDKVRLELPFTMQMRQASYEGTSQTGLSGGSTCGKAVVLGAGAPGASTLVVPAGDWMEVPFDPEFGQAFAGDSEAAITACVDGVVTITTVRQPTEYRWALIDEVTLNALPPDLREMVQGYDNIGFLGHLVDLKSWHDATVVGSSGDVTPCGSSALFWWSGSSGWKFEGDSQETVTCGLFLAGTLNPTSVPSSDYFRGDTGSEVCAGGAGHNLSIFPIGVNISYVQVPLT